MRIFGYEIKLNRIPEDKEERGLLPCVSPESSILFGELGKTILTGESNVQKALSVPAIWAAIKTISETLASLPCDVYRRTADGAIIDERHPVQNIVTLEANQNQSAYDFKRALFANACMGDGFAMIKRNSIGRPVELIILEPSKVKPYKAKNGKLYYEFRNEERNKTELYFAQDVIHIKGLNLDGFEGINVAKAHRETISAAVSAQKFASEFYESGAHVSGAIVYPNALSKDQRDAVEKKMGRVSGVRNAGKTLILDAGVKYERMGLDLEEAGLIPYRNMAVDDAARIFGIPAHLLAQLDRATFNNIEVMNTQFVTLCLRPWAVQMEQEFSRKLLSGNEKYNRSHYIRINLDGLLRGDTNSRASYYNTMFNIGAMSPNDIRDMENLNRRPEGDQYYTPMNMTPAGQANDNVSDAEDGYPDTNQ